MSLAKENKGARDLLGTMEFGTYLSATAHLRHAIGWSAGPVWYIFAKVRVPDAARLPWPGLSLDDGNIIDIKLLLGNLCRNGLGKLVKPALFNLHSQIPQLTSIEIQTRDKPCLVCWPANMLPLSEAQAQLASQ